MEHLIEIQWRLQKVPQYTNTRLFYPADKVKLQYVKSTIHKILMLDGIESAYDFGCGTGVYIQELINQGIDTLGFDGNLGIKRELKTDKRNIIFANLEYPISSSFLPRDLVLSIEFVEHLTEKGGEFLCAIITRLSKKWIVMTASPKDGEFHLNPQPREYWINMIKNFDTHKYRDDLSIEFMQYFRNLIPNGLRWFKQDLMVFERNDV